MWSNECKRRRQTKLQQLERKHAKLNRAMLRTNEQRESSTISAPEGVEVEDDINALNEMNCNIGMGHLRNNILFKQLYVF